MNQRAVGSAPGRDLDLLLTGGSVLGLGDGALLDRVVAGPSPAAEAAFDALIRRHGPMVARVCGGILGDHHTAEDAVQAVFLVLLRRARSIRDPDRLAPWLYGVALRTAREARRRSRSLPLTLNEAPMIDPTPDPSQTTIRREQADLLYGAIARLPRRYLAPVVLCDLEGLTHAEAAAQLNCPTATVSIRIKRAREQLRARLARHRLDFESALPPLTTAGLIPRTLAATASAQLLANRVLWLMASKWKAAVVAAMVAGMTALGAQSGDQDQAAPPLAGVAKTLGANAPATPQTEPAQQTSPALQDKPKPRDIILYPNPPRPTVPGKVVVGTPTVRDVVDVEQYIGRLAPSRFVEVRSHLNGVLRAAPVRDGDQVQQGQVLFQISDPLTEIPMRQQSPELTVARDRMFQEASARDRVMGDPQATEVDKDRASDRYIKLVEKYQEVSAVVTKKIEEATTIRAPFAGRITRRSVDEGATVEVGRTPLATISTVDPIRVDFEIDERTFLKIRRWLRSRPQTNSLLAHVALSDEEGFPHEGRILMQSARPIPEKSTFAMYAELPNPGGELMPGLIAQIRVESSELHPAILIPTSAILYQNGEPRVFVIDEHQVAHWEPVRLGSTFDGLRQITSKFDPETRIVLEGVGSVRDGMLVVGAAALDTPK